MTSRSASSEDADVAVIGDGIIGLTVALELVQAGVTCLLVGAEYGVGGSTAAAGLLAPSIGHLSDAAQRFFSASLAQYPELIEALQPIDPSLSIVRGLLDLSAAATEAPTPPGRLDPGQVGSIESAVVAPLGGWFHPTDGAIDNVRLVQALRRLLHDSPGVRTLHGVVRSLAFDDTGVTLSCESGAHVRAPTVVLAAGAWSSRIAGLPRPVPVRPLKGQMLAVEWSGLRHAVMGDTVYLVPRNGETVIGATVEDAGFDTTVVPAAIERLREEAFRLCPPLAGCPISHAWAGLRPATPDLLPIIGRDPREPRLIYACGHSKNGILLAPATARAVADLCRNQPARYDLGPFSIERFDRAKTNRSN